MQNTLRNETDNIRKGTIHFTQPNAKEPVQDITDLGFWAVDYRFMSNTDVNDEDRTFSGRGVTISGSAGSNISYPSTNSTPNIWLPADSLAKSFYSTILTDLGQTTATPNILTNATALQNFSQNFTSMQRQIVNAVPGPANDSYDALKDQTGALNMSVAVISTKYLCLVPKRKSSGTLFVSILVADLVFMQALWKIFRLCTGAWLTHRDPGANFCSGCEKRTDIALGDLPSTSRKGEIVESEQELISPPLEPDISQRSRAYSRLESDDG
ncbi:uncharacterized protein PAC_01670 [Phialocephala subalpina]|uniref:Uncharacterized protein n=1 Tax=Phialocephala subalpina TaxID=576137 RepID=A0A1L7WGA9_9HELO|nr:uncharacterized protein PAC_01670 [Phialocephala subalpina]